MYIKKPVMVEAYQWFEVSPYQHGIARDVDYYRNPERRGDSKCNACKRIMDDHGWIDTYGGGYTVCPEDFIVTDERGGKFPCKPDTFKLTYEPVKRGALGLVQENL